MNSDIDEIEDDEDDDEINPDDTDEESDSDGGEDDEAIDMTTESPALTEEQKNAAWERDMRAWADLIRRMRRGCVVGYCNRGTRMSVLPNRMYPAAR